MAVLQVNLRRGRAAIDLAFLCEEKGEPVIVLAESNKILVNNSRWLSKCSLTVVLYIRNQKLVKEL